MQVSRRRWLAGLGVSAPFVYAQQRAETPLPIQQYEPKSMLVVPEHVVERSRYPVIDIHAHLTWTDKSGERVRFNATTEELLAVMDRRNIQLLVNLTGGVGPGV